MSAKPILQSVLALFAFFKSEAHEQWKGETYNDAMAIQTHWANKYFISRRNLKGTEIILDIGCGSGKITAKISELVPEGEVEGIDLSQDQIAFAKTHYPRSQYPNLYFTQINAQDFGFYANYREHFNLVVSFAALHWIEDHNKVLRGIYVCLKPGGEAHLFFGTTGEDAVMVATEAVAKKGKWKHYFINFHDGIYRYDESDYEKLARENDFEIVNIERLNIQDVIGNREDLVKLYRAFLPHLKRIPQKLHVEFIDEIVSHYMAKYPKNAPGQIVYYDQYLHVVLRKTKK